MAPFVSRILVNTAQPGLSVDRSGQSAGFRAPPDSRHTGNQEAHDMELRKIGKKGQLTIPRSVLRAAGIAEESRVVIEATADGAIVLRPAAVYAVEMYSE